MKTSEIIRMMLLNLSQNRFRTLLTSIGILIGSLTIVLVIAIGQGGEQQIARQYSNMSAETVYVNGSFPEDGDVKGIQRLNPEDLEVMKQENPYLKKLYLRLLTFDKAAAAAGSALNLACVTQDYAEVSSLELESGSDFAPSDFEMGTQTVVLGADLAKERFGSAEDAIGQTIQIGKKPWQVIGVLKEKREGLQGMNPDLTAFIPWQSGEVAGLFDEYALPQAVGLANSVKDIEKAKKRLKSSLDYLLDDVSAYTIEDAGSRIDAALSSARTMNLLLISVASIVFLVGGIGIMNVLLVSVRERTKEIGILKAVGVARKDILKLFLLEAGAIGVFGGAAGVMVSLLAAPVLSKMQIAAVFSVKGCLLALLFSSAAAVLSGILPAIQAAGLKPVEALNTE